MRYKSDYRSATTLILAAACGITSFAMAQEAPRSGSDAARRGSMDGTKPAMTDGMHRGKDEMHGMYSKSLRDFGVTVRPLDRSLASGHSLKPGVGLVVEEVTAGSVAANGGLLKGDVIFQVEDQWAINSNQLMTLLSIQQPDDGFEVKVYRGTERVDLDYKFDQAALDRMNMGLEEPAVGSADQHTDRELDRGMANRNNPMIVPETFDYKDDAHAITIRTDDSVKKIVVKDANGSVLFEGPYNSAAERDMLPADIRAKVEQVLRERVK